MYIYCLIERLIQSMMFEYWFSKNMFVRNDFSIILIVVKDWNDSHFWISICMFLFTLGEYFLILLKSIEFLGHLSHSWPINHGSLSIIVLCVSSVNIFALTRTTVPFFTEFGM